MSSPALLVPINGLDNSLYNVTDPLSSLPPTVPTFSGSSTPQLGGFSGESLGLPTIAPPSGSGNDWASLITGLANTGVKAWQSDMAANLAQSQIDHNQIPTFSIGQLTGVSPLNPNGALSNSTFFLIAFVLFVVFVIMLLRR